MRRALDASSSPHAGLNHLSWIRQVLVDGVDRLPELLTGDRIGALAGEVDLPAELLRTLHAIPSYYLHYFYCTDRAVRAQASGPQRAEEVLEIERVLLKMYADPALDHKPELLEQRGGAYYSEAAAALVTSLLTGDGGHHYVDIRNNGTIGGLPEEAVVEVSAIVDADGAHPLTVAPLAAELLGLVQAVTAYEVLTIQAARTGDRQVALRALLANPLVRQWDLASPLLDAILAAGNACPSSGERGRGRSRARRSAGWDRAAAGGSAPDGSALRRCRCARLVRGGRGESRRTWSSWAGAPTRALAASSAAQGSDRQIGQALTDTTGRMKILAPVDTPE